MTDRLAELRAADVTALAARLGLRVQGRGIAPCPACSADQRGDRDRRPPVLARSDGRGWRCYRCDASGDAVGLVAWLVTGTPRPASWRPVFDALDALGMGELPVLRVPPVPVPAHVAAWRSIEAQAREWQRSGVPFHGDEPALGEHDALVMALACSAAVAGWTGPDAWRAAAEYAERRRALDRQRSHQGGESQRAPRDR